MTGWLVSCWASYRVSAGGHSEGVGAGAPFDRDLEAGLEQLADGVRNQRDPALAGALLGDDSDPHDR